MTRVSITPTGAPAAWDFLIDTVAFNQNITGVVNAPPPPVVQPPAPPVQGDRHGRGKGEVELLEVNFGDDINDIRGSVETIVPAVPEPSSWAMLLVGSSAFGWAGARRRKPRKTPV